MCTYPEDKKPDCRLSKSPGDTWVLHSSKQIYLDNGHVTLPQPGKPLGAGIVLVFETPLPDENELLIDALRWTANSTTRPLSLSPVNVLPHGLEDLASPLSGLCIGV
jgi:hypothetical protein